LICNENGEDSKIIILTHIMVVLGTKPY